MCFIICNFCATHLLCRHNLEQLCARETYTRSVLYPQHPAQSLAHSRTLVFFNEGVFGPQLPQPIGSKEWDGLPTKAGLVPDVDRAPTVCKPGVGAESDSGSQVQNPGRLRDYSEN